MESIDLVQDKSQEKVLDWDATVKLNLLPLFLPNAKYSQNLSTQITFADHQYNNDGSYFEPSTMNQNLKIKKKGYASRTANNARSMSLEWLVNYNIGIKDHNIRAMAGYSYQYWLEKS